MIAELIPYTADYGAFKRFQSSSNGWVVPEMCMEPSHSKYGWAATAACSVATTNRTTRYNLITSSIFGRAPGAPCEVPQSRPLLRK